MWRPSVSTRLRYMQTAVAEYEPSHHKGMEDCEHSFIKERKLVEQEWLHGVGCLAHNVNKKSWGLPKRKEKEGNYVNKSKSGTVNGIHWFGCRTVQREVIRDKTKMSTWLMSLESQVRFSLGGNKEQFKNLKLLALFAFLPRKIIYMGVKTKPRLC